MLNSSWIGDAVTGVVDGLFSGSVRLGVSNKTVETDPEFRKSSLSLSLPEGREDGTCWLYFWIHTDPHSHARCQLACSFMGQKWKSLGFFFFLDRLQQEKRSHCPMSVPNSTTTTQHSQSRGRTHI